MRKTDEGAQIITRLAPLADVLAAIDALPAVAPRDVGPASAIGRVLATDVITDNVPSAPIALRDGWALAGEATADASSYAPIRMPIPPRVDVGQVMPAGTDAVAGFDAVMLRGGCAEVLAPLAPGDGVLPADGDAQAGEILRCAGTCVRHTDAAAFAAAGIEHVSIRKPRLRVVVVRHDRVLDAVLPMIESDIGRLGNVLSDNAMSLDRELDDENCDALILIGGTGSGREDRSVQALAKRGSVSFHGIGLSPGETAAFGRVGTRPVLVLPGRVDAAWAAWRVIGRRLLAALSGSSEADPTSTASLTRKVTSTVGMVDFIPVARDGDKVEPLARQYLPLSVLTRADGFILVPAESEGYRAGTHVAVRPWS